MLPGLIFTVLALWPFVEARFSGDRHGLLSDGIVIIAAMGKSRSAACLWLGCGATMTRTQSHLLSMMVTACQSAASTPRAYGSPDRTP